MRTPAVAFLLVLAVASCRTAPEPATGPPGYTGIDKIQIMATGME